MKMIPCPQCGEDFPELRKTKYGYNFCVNCSEVGAKRGVPMTFGTGDHTWTETLILDEKDYLKLHRTKYLLKRDEVMEVMYEIMEDYANHVIKKHAEWQFISEGELNFEYKMHDKAKYLI